MRFRNIGVLHNVEKQFPRAFKQKEPHFFGDRLRMVVGTQVDPEMILLEHPGCQPVQTADQSRFMEDRGLSSIVRERDDSRASRRMPSTSWTAA